MHLGVRRSEGLFGLLALSPVGVFCWLPTSLFPKYPEIYKMSAESISICSRHNNRGYGDNNAAAASALEFLRLAGRLKGTVRTGWVYSGVGETFTCRRVESVADHSWRMTIATFLYSNVPIEDDLLGMNQAEGSARDRRCYDVARMCQMAAFHDIAESLTGDIAPADKVSKETKARLESEATATLASALSGWSPNSSASMQTLIHEYEARITPESIAVKDLDMLEMIVQADSYEIMNAENCSTPEPRKLDSQHKHGACTSSSSSSLKKIDLSDFFHSTSGKFKTAPARAIADELVRQRDSRLDRKRGNS